MTVTELIKKLSAFNPDMHVAEAFENEALRDEIEEAIFEYHNKGKQIHLVEDKINIENPEDNGNLSIEELQSLRKVNEELSDETKEKLEELKGVKINASGQLEAMGTNASS